MTSRPSSRQRRSAIALLFAITAAKVLVFVALHAYGVRPFVGSNAQDHYLPTAHRLVEEGRFNGTDSRPDSKVPPGYSLVIATAMRATPGQPLVTVVALQFVADLVTAVAVYWLASLAGNPATAFIAAGLWTVFPPAVAISTWITSETFFISLLTAGTAVFVHALRSRSAAASGVAGILTGAATYFRGTSLLLPIVYAPALLLQRRYREATIFALATYCVVAPWTLRNYLVLDDPITMSVGIGGVFLQGSDARYFTGTGKAAEYPALFERAAAEGLPKPASDKESGIDSWLGAIGLRNYERRLDQNPVSMITFTGHKFLRLWYGTEAAGWELQAALAGCSMLLVPIGAWQWWRWRKVWPVEVAVIASQAGYFVALHVVTLPEFRYMLPLFPLCAVGVAGYVAGRDGWSIFVPRWLESKARPPVTTQ